MKERILHECSTRGTCALNRKEFNESFAGHDLTTQVRAAIDFAQNNGLAFGRSTGDQSFIFSRLSKAPAVDQTQRRKPPREGSRWAKRGPRPKKKFGGAQNRPFGRSF